MSIISQDEKRNELFSFSAIEMLLKKIESHKAEIEKLKKTIEEKNKRLSEFEGQVNQDRILK